MACVGLGRGIAFSQAFGRRVQSHIAGPAAAARAMPLKIVVEPILPATRQYEAALVLVRPDQFVAWCGDAANDANAVLSCAVGDGLSPI